MSLTHLLFSFRGRLNRKPFWITNIAIGIITTPLILLALVMAGESLVMPGEMAGEVMLGERALTFINLTGVILGLLFTAIGAKRLHDRDKSAWWLLVFYAMPVLLSTARNWMEDAGSVIMNFIGSAIAIWAFIELWCLRGTPGPNRYGPDPLSTPT